MFFEKNKRRQYYIKKDFQGSFILRFCLLVIIGSVVSGVILYVICGRTVTTSFENSRLVIKNTADYILPTLVFSGLAVVAVIAFAAGILTLFTSHKIAGPLYHMQKAIGEIGRGDLNTNIKLRKKDEVTALADTINAMTGALKRDMSRIKQIAAELNVSIGNLPDSAEKKGLLEKKKYLDKAIEFFKT